MSAPSQLVIECANGDGGVCGGHCEMCFEDDDDTMCDVPEVSGR